MRVSRIASEIERKGIDFLVGEFGKYLKDINLILKRNSINFEVEHKKLTESYEKFVKKTLKKLKDPKRIKKLSAPFISTGMPEIWEDNLAFSDFSDSFFDYISISLSGRSPRIIKSIKDRVGLVEGLDSEEIESRLIDFFDSDDGEWSDEDWK